MTSATTSNQSIMDTLAAIQSTLDTITQNISASGDSIDEKVLKEISKKINKVVSSDPYIRANAILSTLLADHIGPEMAKDFADTLNQCRIRGNYMTLHRFHYKVKHSEKLRQLLLMCSALYRLKFTPGSSSNESSLKSCVKYATQCSHCGDVAKEIKERFEKIDLELQ